MSVSVRFFASAIALLSATHALADVRPVPPGHGPGYPHPGPGYPHPGPGYPAPLPPAPGYPYPRDPSGYPQPPSVDAYACHELNGGFDTFTVSPAAYSRSGYIVDLNAQNVNISGLEAFLVKRTHDTMVFRFNSPYGDSKIRFGYLNHPYGPTAVLSLGGGFFQEFKCQRFRTLPSRPSPMPPSPYPPSPTYPPSPFPYPHR